MLKNKSKVFVAVLVVLLLLTTFTFATDGTAVPLSSEGNLVSTVPGDNAKTTEGGDNTPEAGDTSTEEIYDGDLYIFDSNVVMDRLVDGNVYIIGNNVEITGKVNGNLFVLGNTVTFQKGSYVVQSVYVAATKLEYNGNAGDLYATAGTVNMSYDGFVIRDLKLASQTFNFNGGVGRDADVSCKNFNFVTEEGKAAIVYGNLNYRSENKLDISSAYVQGEVTYSEYSALDVQPTIQETIYEYVISFVQFLLLTLAIYLLLLLVAPKFIENCASFVSAKAVPALGLGILLTILVPIISIMLVIIPVTTTIGLFMLGIYGLLLFLCGAIVSITIANKLKEKFNFTKIYQTILTILVTALVIWALPYIPYVGFFITLLIIFSGFGITFMHLFMKNVGKKKEVTSNDTTQE